MRNMLMSAVVVTSLGALVGCGSQSRLETDVATDGLVQVRSAYPTLLYTRPGAPELGTYDRFIVGDIRFILTKEDRDQIPAQDLEYMAGYLQSAIELELGRSGYRVGAGSASEALLIEFKIKGLVFEGTQTRSDGGSGRGRSNGGWLDSMRVGSLVLEGSFTNARANRMDALVVSEVEARGFQDAQWWSNWEDVERSLDQWAQGIRAEVERTSSGMAFPD